MPRTNSGAESRSPGGRLELVEPSTAYMDSYRSLAREFADAGEPFVPFCVGWPNEDFPALLERLAACSRGEGIPEGFVPHTTYWLVRGDAEVVAVSNLRHRLTDRLRREGGNIGYGVRPSARRRGYAAEALRQTLPKARAMGMARALITCAKANLGSVGAILRNGGVLDSEEFLPERGEVVQRYWIALR